MVLSCFCCWCCCLAVVDYVEEEDQNGWDMVICLNGVHPKPDWVSDIPEIRTRRWTDTDDGPGCSGNLWGPHKGLVNVLRLLSKCTLLFTKWRICYSIMDINCNWTTISSCWPMIRSKGLSWETRFTVHQLKIEGRNPTDGWDRSLGYQVNEDIIGYINYLLYDVSSHSPFNYWSLGLM